MFYRTEPPLRQQQSAKQGMQRTLYVSKGQRLLLCRDDCILFWLLETVSYELGQAADIQSNSTPWPVLWYTVGQR